MRSRTRFISIIAALVAAPAAFAQPQFLVGARAGVAAPNELGFDLGPMAGVDVAYALQRLVALELAVEQSFHAVTAVGGQKVRGNATVGNLGVQYRIDVTPSAVPYVLLAIESRWMRVAGQQTRNLSGGAFAVGILVPFTQHWSAGLEARYGITLQGSFPLRQVYLAKIGYRTAGF